MAVPRILRNYLISFAVIGLLWLVVVVVDRCVGARMEPDPPVPEGPIARPVPPPMKSW